MSCFILFCLSNLYVDVELSKPRFYTEIKEGEYNRLEGWWCSTRACKGPLAEVKIGMPVQVTDRVSVTYGYKHMSFPQEKKDKGQDGLFLNVKWEPFK